MVTSAENLLTLKDDMIAFVEGHGMFRFKGYVDETVATVSWEDESNPESWKDFVEAAKAAGALFVTMSESTLEAEELEELVDLIEDESYPDTEHSGMEEAEDLEKYIGRVGFVQLGFAHQGVMFLHETATEWYERYQDLLEHVEALGGILLEDENEE